MGSVLRFFCSLFAIFAFAVPEAALAQPVAQPAQPPSAPFEIVRSHIDIDVNADGSSVETEDTALRVLDSRGQESLRRRTLSYTEGLQSIDIESAYALKADGEKIDVPERAIFRNSAAPSAPGFENAKLLTVYFPRLDIGDEVVLVTAKKQTVPAFPGAFAMRKDFSRAVKADDVQVTLTTPENGPSLRIEAIGLEGGQPQTYGTKIRRIWLYRNDAPITRAPDAVAAVDDNPHLVASSFPDYQSVGRAYGAYFSGKADTTPEIESLADQLTHGISDRRAEAAALYDWVCRNIAYVDLVPGAGGFAPHAAADVLALRSGDSKDHVVLLEALLAAKGIASEPALIAADGPYVLPDAPSPFYFNHLITYVPEQKLFVDSTERYAPFGVLPFADADRPAVLVSSGTILDTPNASADQTTGRATVSVKFDADGTANGQSQIWLTGSAAVDERSNLAAIPPERENDVLQPALGPGAQASVDRGNLQAGSDPFAYSLQYRVPNAANFSAPGAVSASLGAGPFAAAGVVLGQLPPSRNTAYACPSMATSEHITFAFPPGVNVTSIPLPVSIVAEGVRFEMHYQMKDPQTVAGSIMLRMDHPRAFCTPDYYAKTRSDLERIATSLRGKILYK